MKIIIFLGMLISYYVLQSSILPIKIITEKNVRHFTVINENRSYSSADAYVQKVTNGTNIFIIEQINDPSIDEQFLLINDAIASTIGSYAGIAVNEISFVPYNVACHLKKYPERAATLHTYVSGTDLESKLPDFLPPHFTLQQRIIDLKSKWQQKYPLQLCQEGFTRDIIECMSLNKQLSSLCALDTFVGNIDRSRPNIFYDQLNRCFYGIDLAASFSKNLPALACARIRELMAEGHFAHCSLEVIDGLSIYQNTLRQLYEHNSPSIIVQSMHLLTRHLVPHVVNRNAVQARIDYHCSKNIENNYADTLRLVELLDEILCSKVIS